MASRRNLEGARQTFPLKGLVKRKEKPMGELQIFNDPILEPS